jgi:hypothetical protein
LNQRNLAKLGGKFRARHSRKPHGPNAAAQPMVARRTGIVTTKTVPDG